MEKENIEKKAANDQNRTEAIEFFSQEYLNEQRRIKRDHKVKCALDEANNLLNELKKEMS